MSILKSGRPTSKKEKALAAVQDNPQKKIARLQILVPYSLLKGLKQRALDEETTLTEITIKVLNEYMNK